MRIQYKLMPAILLLASCHITQKYKSPDVPLAAQYRQEGGDTNSIAAIPWHEFFSDTALRALISEGISNNLDLQVAHQRIIAASTALWKSRQAFMPDLTGNLGVKQSRLPFPQGFGFVTNATQFDVGLSASWEADIWGKLGSARKAAYAQLLATGAAQRAIQTQLIADIALNYIQLLSLDEQLELLHKTVENRKEDVVTMEALNASNMVNSAAVVQSRANYAAAKVAIPDVKRQIRETENALCILLNRQPGVIGRGRLERFGLPEQLATGVPAGLLVNRPDIRQAEQQLRVAFENTNTARAFFYPSVRITGGAGFSSFEFSKWISSAGLFANIAAGLTQPVLARGENKARLKMAQSEQEIALLEFRKTMTRACQEVSNALYMVEIAEEKQKERTIQLQNLEKSVEYTKVLLRYNSSTNYTDVLTSENILLNAQSGNINDKLQRLQGIITLYRALGGGWK